MSYDFNQDMRQWADIEGGFHPDRQWLLSSADTWHENPHYKGDPQPHPDDEVGENNQEPDVINCSEGALIATRDNIKQQIIDYLCLEGAINETIKTIVDENFKRIGVISP